MVTRGLRQADPSSTACQRMVIGMSERKGETKRQHYVPRMILRSFSNDGKRISLLVDGRRIDGASLRDQCQED